jgi:hypothetical protein
MIMTDETEVTYGKTAVGQLLFDLAFQDLTDKWLARKHQVTIAEIRNLRKSPILNKLRRQVKRDLLF